MSDKTIKAILFDLGNVVIGVDASRLEKAYAENGRRLREGEVLRYFNESDNMNRYMEGKLTSSQFYEKTRRIFKLKMKYGEFYRSWNDIFYPLPEMEKIIAKIKKEYPAIKLVLLSNTNESHYAFIKEAYKVLELFDAHLVSHEFGKQKPHPDIFKAALKLTGTLPRDTFYTDDREDLIDAARVMGIRAFQFTGPDTLRRNLEKFGIDV